MSAISLTFSREENLAEGQLTRGTKIKGKIKVKNTFKGSCSMFFLELLLFDPQFPQKVPSVHPRHQILAVGMVRGILKHLAFRELSNVLGLLPIVKGFEKNISGSALGSITENMYCKYLFTLRDGLLVVEFERLGGERHRVVGQRGD